MEIVTTTNSTAARQPVAAAHRRTRVVGFGYTRGIEASTGTLVN
jgi:hypothetical protein